MTTWAELQALAVDPLEARAQHHTRTWATNPTRQCAGKVTYAGRSSATKAAKGAAKRNGDKRMRPYRCDACHQWHLAKVGRSS